MSGAHVVAAAYPGSFFLSAEDLPGLTAYLTRQAWLAPGETVHTIERAGEGNMNCVLRVSTNERSFIVKQSRPWVEKYPAIAAPWDRALMEEQFYRTATAHPGVAAQMPKLLASDGVERLLLLEDLPHAGDFSFLYRSKRELEDFELLSLTQFLVFLHSRFRDPALAKRFANVEMRKLNHEHIFSLPLNAANGLSLDAITPGLGVLAKGIQRNEAFCDQVTELGKIYLASPADGCLLHGDYFPGSWLTTSRGVFVIDPEFCFYGTPEWDLGVMLAHLHLSGQSIALCERMLTIYAGQAPVDAQLLKQFAGVEIMRRLIGVAQLPLPATLSNKERLLNLAQDLVLGKQ